MERQAFVRLIQILKFSEALQALLRSLSQKSEKGKRTPKFVISIPFSYLCVQANKGTSINIYRLRSYRQL
ncbi:MAG: hypothetical protein NZ551_01735 [Microscillaceae bacterium]|nr:hypothetical protein [Microscillaceae bacterium]MDW8459909.1 hypothetical protein [Cytophagales bacterium]